ncbi:hypothetical protein PENSPDRAFT_645640 [Peniophora sp. CONT]|nr:hypothetical protein PENSPDRAFT_645640 [Peniophora sp. CONT]
MSRPIPSLSGRLQSPYTGGSSWAPSDGQSTRRPLRLLPFTMGFIILFRRTKYKQSKTSSLSSFFLPETAHNTPTATAQVRTQRPKDDDDMPRLPCDTA